MHFSAIDITRLESGCWCVEQGGGSDKSIFKSKVSAVAFGRALAHSSRAALYILGPDGTKIRQPKESLTYPVRLD